MKRFAIALGALFVFLPAFAMADYQEEGAPLAEEAAPAEAEAAAEEAAPAAEEAAPVADEAAPSGEKVHSVNLNILAPLTKSYTLNYVYLLNGTHGFMIEPGISMSSGSDSDYTTYGAVLGYRWHWDGGQDTGFLGANLGYFTGSGTSLGEDLTVTQLSLIPNIGWRWAWDSGLNITLRFGIGYGDYGASTESDDEVAKVAVKAMDDLLNLIPIAFDGEFSIGWCF